MYNLTMKPSATGANMQRVLFGSSNPKKEPKPTSNHGSLESEDMGLSSLGCSLRQIDRNMSRIKSLDVVQQLQAGLF